MEGTVRGRCDTLSIVLLPLARPLELGEVLGRVLLRGLVVAALIEDLWQVSSVNLPELLKVTESRAHIPVFTCMSKTQVEYR